MDKQLHRPAVLSSRLQDSTNSTDVESLIKLYAALHSVEEGLGGRQGTRLPGHRFPDDDGQALNQGLRSSGGAFGSNWRADEYEPRRSWLVLYSMLRTKTRRLTNEHIQQKFRQKGKAQNCKCRLQSADCPLQYLQCTSACSPTRLRSWHAQALLPKRRRINHAFILPNPRQQGN